MTELVFKASDIPQDVAELLQESAGLHDKAAWTVGRLTNIMMDDLKAEGVQYSRMSLYKAIGAHCSRASETVRQCAHVHRLFPKWLIERHEWLGFHQAKALVPLGKGDETVYEDLIERWQQHCEQTQISVTSVDGLRAWLHQEDGAPSPALVRYHRLISQMHKVIETGDTPGGIAAVLRNALKELEYVARQQKCPEWVPEEL